MKLKDNILMLFYHIMENLQLSALCEIEQNNPLITNPVSMNFNEKSQIKKNNEEDIVQQNSKERSHRNFEFDTYIKKMNSVLSGYKIIKG